MDKQQTLSVIIPIFNGAAFLDQLLSALVSQTRMPDEILLIDSSSTDASLVRVEQYMEKYPFIRLYQIPQQDFDHGGTRTIAARLARKDILLFMTQDALPAENTTLERLLHAFTKDPKIAAAYGRQLPAENANFFGEHLRLFNYPQKSQIRSQQDWNHYGFKTVFISNSFAAWRRDILKKQGYFPEHLVFGEDTLLLSQLLTKGYSVAYVSGSAVYHSHNYSIVQDFKRYFDIGVFHETQAEHMLRHGNPTGAGKKYVRSELALIAEKKKYHLLPEFFLRNLCKFVAYKIGRKFKMLPPGWPARFSMNPGWWRKA